MIIWDKIKWDFITYQECIVTMCTGYPAHTRNSSYRRCNRTRCQINNPLAIRSWTCDPLRWTLAYQQTIAGATHVFLSRRCISYRLNNNNINRFWVEKKLICFLHTVASLHWQHLTTCWSRFPEISIIAWQTRQVTIGTPPAVGPW